MKPVTCLLLVVSLLFGSSYGLHDGKAYLLDASDVRIIASQGSRRLPLFGLPSHVVFGSRPYVLTSKAVFSLDPSSEEVSAVTRLDRFYSKATVGANDRIYLLGGDVLSVLEGSAARISLLYTYALPQLAGDMFMLASGELLLLPVSGVTAFTYNPVTKQTSNIKLPWQPERPLLAGSVLVDVDAEGLRFFNLSSSKSTTLSLEERPSSISSWQGKVLAVTSKELVMADPSTASVVARLSITGVNKISVVDSENMATVLRGNDLITVGLPSLVPRDTFNASCSVRASAYPFLGKPLFVCGDKLALPGASDQTSNYLAQPVQSTEGRFYSLQVGAFSDPMSFGPLMESLARQGLSYYAVEEGELTKFRVGFFKTRQEADRVRDFLQNYGAWVVAESSTQRLTYSIHDLNRDVRPDAVVFKDDSVLVMTLKEGTWIEILKASRLPAPVKDVYLKANQAFAELEGLGLRELVLPDSTN